MPVPSAHDIFLLPSVRQLNRRLRRCGGRASLILQTWRFYVDDRCLNAVTRKDFYPLPRMDDALDSISGSSWFSSLNLQFIRDFATIASALHQLTQKDQDFQWSESCAEAFARLGSTLSAAPALSFPDSQKTFIVDMDASNVGPGAVLSHEGEHREQAIAYFSRTLSKPERNYCVTR